MDKMQVIVAVSLLLGISKVNAQQLTGVIENHPRSKMELVLMPFGMDYPIVAGTVDQRGQFAVNLDGLDLKNVPNEVQSMFEGELGYSFFFGCNDREEFGLGFEVPAYRVDYIRMNQGDQWAGTAFLVSDEKLRPWLEDSGYNNAIPGSFFEVIYVAEEVSIHTACSEQIYVSDEESVEVEYDFQLELKKGFNWVEYEIEEVFETNPEIRASFPSKVKIKNPQDLSAIKWVGTYY
ncbi:hypothetical protein DFQ04_1057 [Algoriphagus boseongensis]|uniref:WG repeat protein n=1 Tax=Algoriphagus boseongensis TaxID=1442587 RepID=A0A4R6T917_9BACT|nr:hypothetical protein [Algoriphagus]TDQ19236.1 hypothetical protein DFQ04_1057 [Algoriphagus boseongensis]